MKFNAIPKPQQRYITTGIRKAFAYSESYSNKFKEHQVIWYDGNRRRVSYPCSACAQVFPKQDCKLDHEPPVIPLESSLDDMDIGEYVDRVWFGPTQILCVSCHREKTNKENSQRRSFKKKKKL